MEVIEFIKTGLLNGFPFGVTKDFVVNELGENPDWTVQINRKDKRPALIKYDRVEFYFTSDIEQVLWGIQVKYSQPAEAKQLQIDYGDFISCLKYEEVKGVLKENSISFEESMSNWDPNTQVVTTIHGVTFYFNDDLVLEKFGRFIV